MKIERVVSPGGIEAWLVESHANPLIAMRLAFRGGSTQDPEGKAGLAYFISSMMDEGAGSLDAIAFQEREQALAMRMDFDASRDVMLGSVQTLTANKDEVFDLVHLALTGPRFDADAVERVRAQILAGLKFDENDPETVAAASAAMLANGSGELSGTSMIRMPALHSTSAISTTRAGSTPRRMATIADSPTSDSICIGHRPKCQLPPYPRETRDGGEITVRAARLAMLQAQARRVKLHQLR